jgi:L-threonylcarbamoyladenylate synthase
MKPVLVPYITRQEQEAALPAVLEHLDRGGMVATPTETVYGLGCEPAPEPLRRLARIKERADGQSFLVLVRAAADVPGVIWTESASLLAGVFWPGPLTLVLEAGTAELPAALRGPGGTLAIRATPHEGIRRLLDLWRRPLPSTSANPRGREAAQSAAEVYDWIRDVPGDDEMLILDGGTLPVSRPSTIVDCTGPRPRLLREGALQRVELERIVHDIEP